MSSADKKFRQTRRRPHDPCIICKIVDDDEGSIKLFVAILLAHLRDAVVSPNDGVNDLIVELVVEAGLLLSQHFFCVLVDGLPMVIEQCGGRKDEDPMPAQSVDVQYEGDEECGLPTTAGRDADCA